jgi:hypothetical protein
MTTVIEDEQVRAAKLLDAQVKAVQLFDAIVERGLITPGVREVAASDAIRDLANDMFGTTKYWHKRIIRAGVNTLLPYRENPPDRVIEDDDIAFADFGPIFEDFEADLRARQRPRQASAPGRAAGDLRRRAGVLRGRHRHHRRPAVRARP